LGIGQLALDRNYVAAVIGLTLRLMLHELSARAGLEYIWSSKYFLVSTISEHKLSV